MAKVYNFQGDSNQPVIMEDPRANNDGWWIFGMRHDKTSLTPAYNKKMNWTLTTGFSNGFVNNQVTTGDMSQNQLMLKKMTVHSPQWSSSGHSTTNVPRDNAWRWMDEQMEQEVSFNTWTEHDNGSGSKRLMYWTTNGSTAYGRGFVQDIPDDTYIDEVRLSNNADPQWSNVQNVMSHPSWTNNGYIHAFGMFDQSSHYYYPTYRWMTCGSSWPSSYDSAWSSQPSGMSSYWMQQILGHSQVDGQPIVAGLYVNTGTTGESSKFVKATLQSSSSPAWTVLDTLNQVQTAAAGTHAGGYKLNNKAMPTTHSKTFTDPRDAGKKAFYRGWWDINSDFHPFLTTWNLSDDTFAIETDISIAGDKSSVHANLLTSDITVQSVTTTTFYTETWVSNGTRYVGYFPLVGRNHSNETSDSAMRTCIVYEVDAANPKALTYHSKLEFGSLARTVCWLNDSRTMLGVFHKNNFVIYVWNDTTGWGETTNIPNHVSSIGRDSLDRIWYCQVDGEVGGTSPELHLLTPTLPVTVSITPETDSYAYAGSDISSYINVSAINASGARIATSVKLVIEGSSMTFADGSSTKTVTTLTTGDLQVNTTISGAGFTNVTASIEI